MENASKALVMAGGVLIGVMILTLAVYLFIDFGTTSAEINAQNAQKQIVEFNSKFTSYSDKEVTIYDVITVANYAIENNKYYEDFDEYENEYKITVKVDDINLMDPENKDKLKELMKYDNDSISALTKKLPKYECESEKIIYHENGRVDTLIFKKIQ